MAEINPNIILQNAPMGAAATINPATSNLDPNVVFKSGTFKPISVVDEQYKSAVRKDELAQIDTAARQRDQQERDRKVLSDYIQSGGGDLFSTQGLKKALTDLKGTASLEALSGIQKQLDVSQQKETNAQTSISKLDDAALDLDDKRTEFATRLMSAPLEVYNQATKEPGQEPQAREAFNAARAQVLDEATQATVPGTDRPLYDRKFLDRLAKASPQELQVILQNTKWYGDKLKSEAALRASSALVERREAQTVNEKERNEISMKRAEAALEKAKSSGSMNPDDVNAAAELISNYRMQPLSGFALRTPYGQAVVAKVKELNPEFDGKEYFSRAKSEKDFATGRQGNTVRSLNVAIAHLNTLDNLSDALANSDIKLINTLSNRVAKETGAAAPVNFEAAKKIVADEIVKAIVGTGGGVTDRQEAAATISAANSPAQLKGVIKTYKELMHGQLVGLRDQYKAATNKDDFDKRFLSKEAQAVTEEIEAGQGIKPAAKQYRQIGRYKTPDEVRNDFRSGKLSREEAKNVLTRMGF